MRCFTRRTAGAALALLVAAAAFAAPVTARAATPGVPYTDPGAVGSIGLCNKAGQQITHGNINTAPFVARAVSTKAAAAPYNVPGRTATLYAYQPLQVLAAGDWSGAQLTAATRYANVAHPTAVATAADGSLANFIGQYRPEWDGLLQLRIFLDAPNQQVGSLTYPATTIKVTGDTWQVVGPAPTVSCNSGAAVSIESILLPHSSGTAKHALHPQSTPPAGSTTPATAKPGAPASHPATAAPAPASSLAAASTSDSSSSSGHGGLVAGLVALVVVLAVVGFLVVRRRNRPTTGSG